MTLLAIAIDGPASSGKSTIAKLLANRLNITYLDTGAMYRAVTLAYLQRGLTDTEPATIDQLLDTMELSFQWIDGSQHIFLNGEDVSEAIRSVEVTENVSEISAIEKVRVALVALQQKMAAQTAVVMDGRDIGTVVLPQAPYKFFLTASPEVRALRRYKENQQRGMMSQSLEELTQAIIERDHYDSTREHSPLKKADDAIEIDTSDMTIDELIQQMLAVIQAS
ncbi:MAG: (d)CMP kinase [Aerococcaceae bacterium]|nr:(d)CMP kinase [Aerococcaceae bacterium]